MTHPGYVLAPAGLIVVNVNALQLEVAGALIGTARVNAVLVADDLPKL